MNKQNKKANKLAVEGIIIPANWDDNGRITDVTIHTDDEQIYFVEQTGAGQELSNLIHEKVKAKGKIRERLDGHRHIAVQSYQKVEEDKNGFI